MLSRRRRITVWIVVAIVVLALADVFGPWLYFQIACRIVFCDM